MKAQVEMEVGLNVGSGQRPFKSTEQLKWVNIDKVSRPAQGLVPDLECDGAHLPIGEGSADYFVLHHVLEHFGCGEASGLIQEAYRVLKFGGSLLVFVPDMDALARRWLTGEISTQIYMTNVYGAYMGHQEDRHKWGYDYNSLVNFLNASVHWHGVRGFNWRRIPGAEIAQDWWILGVECIK